MHHLVINGDPGIRKDAVIEVEGEELICFSVKRQGDWHGPDRVQLWCTVGTEDERETYERREYISMHLDVEKLEADAVSVVSKGGTLNI
jgi:hypothetical protein